MAGMAESTKLQCEGHLNKLKDFCNKEEWSDHFNIALDMGLNYLRLLFEQGKSYSTINSAI